MEGIDIALKHTILRVLVGSEAYGLNVGTGDRDEKGVCLEPVEAMLGFSRFEQYEYRTASEREGRNDAKSEPGDLDLTIYSLRKFLQLALKGNPTIVEMLFLKSYIEVSSLGHKLQELAPKIISRQAGKAYLGYMQAQKQRLLGERGGKDVNRPDLVEKYGFDTKYAMHAVRLGLQGIELLTKQTLTLPLVGVDKSVLLDIRNGMQTLKWVTDYIQFLEGVLKELIHVSPLQERPDVQSVEEWMVRVYWQMWKAQRFQSDLLEFPPVDPKWDGVRRIY